MNKFLLSAIVLLAFGTIASGVRCYVCSYTNIDGVGVTGETCNGPSPSSTHLFNCTTDYCLTTVTTVTVGVSSTAIARTCGTSSVTGTCVDSSVGSVCTYSCNTDDCNSTNGSGKVNLNFLVMIVTLFAGFVLASFKCTH